MSRIAFDGYVNKYDIHNFNYYLNEYDFDIKMTLNGKLAKKHQLEHRLDGNNTVSHHHNFSAIAQRSIEIIVRGPSSGSMRIWNVKVY